MLKAVLNNLTNNLLNKIFSLADDDSLKSTVTQKFSPIDAANLIKVHALLETGKTSGKLVLEGFRAADL